MAQGLWLAKGPRVSRLWAAGAEAGQRARVPEAGVRAEEGRAQWKVAYGRWRTESGRGAWESGRGSQRWGSGAVNLDSGGGRAWECGSPGNPGAQCGVMGEERRARRIPSGGACAPGRRAGALPSAGSWRQCRRRSGGSRGDCGVCCRDRGKTATPAVSEAEEIWIKPVSWVLSTLESPWELRWCSVGSL